jgi:hypothetical protein
MLFCLLVLTHVVMMGSLMVMMCGSMMVSGRQVMVLALPVRCVVGPADAKMLLPPASGRQQVDMSAIAPRKQPASTDKRNGNPSCGARGCAHNERCSSSMYLRMVK